MTNTIHHLPEDEYIVEEKIEGETAIVSTEVRWKNGYRKGEVEPYEYEFMRLNGTWVLNQIYLLAPRGRFECI